MFLVLEGIDGCGKTTQARRVVEELKKRGVEPLHLHEPGGTVLGERLRSLILTPDANVEIHSRAEALLYSAARAELVRMVLMPAIKERKSIVCERYYYSTLAYQGYGLVEDTGPLQSLSAYATQMVKPDRVVLLDVDPNTALNRVGKNLDRIEARGPEYMHRVREGYRLLARREPDRWRIIDASKPSDQVSKLLLDAIADVLP